MTAAETTVQAAGQTVPLVYRAGACAHLRFTSGRCPRSAREVAVSQSLAFLLHWHTGQRIAVPAWGHLAHNRPVPGHRDGRQHPVLV